MVTPLMSPVESRTKVEAVAEALRRRILNGELPPGTPLLQEEMASQLGVSPTPVVLRLTW